MTTSSVVIALKDRTTYHGMYRVKVTHLPLEAVARLLILICSVSAFVPLWLSHGPEWAILLTGYFSASLFTGLCGTLVRLLIQAMK